MNKISQIRLVVLMWCGVLSGSQLLAAKADMLIGTWKVKDLKYQYEIPQELKPTFDKSIAEIKETFTITYSDNGTYITKVKGQQLNGVWKFDEATSVITAKPDGGAEKLFRVLELTEQSLSFNTQEANSEVTFIMERSSSGILFKILAPVFISVIVILVWLFFRNRRQVTINK